MSQLIHITHDIYLEHDTGPGHPERPERLETVHRTMSGNMLTRAIPKVVPEPAAREIILSVHDADYMARLDRMFADGHRVLDGGDTVVGEQSLDAAFHAAGAVVKAIDLIQADECQRVFCSVRPPGHHAEKNRAMGFCIFNNAAVAARYARKTGMADRILIIDWDVHHGNGTQHIFEEDPAVFYYSMHQYPFYPGTGAREERGRGPGEGFTLNRPLSAGGDDHLYLDMLQRDLEEIEKTFQADLVIISAGFDAHRFDPLGGMNVTEAGFARMTEIVNQYAWRHANGRILSVLEGGYHLQALADSVAAHLEILIKH